MNRSRAKQEKSIFSEVVYSVILLVIGMFSTYGEKGATLLFYATLLGIVPLLSAVALRMMRVSYALQPGFFKEGFFYTILLCCGGVLGIFVSLISQ